MATAARLQERYQTEIVPTLQKDLGRQNVLSLPRVSKVVISMGLGKALLEKKRLASAVEELGLIVGQRAVVTKARKSISGFKVREGNETGVMVTLRRRKMYEFLDRLINVAIPRIRDFRGLNPKGFDGRGNYNFGISEQLIFPEISIEKVEFQQGMNITICVTGTRNDRESHRLLELFGMPFKR